MIIALTTLYQNRNKKLLSISMCFSLQSIGVNTAIIQHAHFSQFGLRRLVFGLRHSRYSSVTLPLDSTLLQSRYRTDIVIDINGYFFQIVFCAAI